MQRNNNKNNIAVMSLVTGQLGAIRRTSLAKILCENGDNLEHIQPRVMLLPLSEVYGRLR